MSLALPVEGPTVESSDRNPVQPVDQKAGLVAAETHEASDDQGAAQDEGARHGNCPNIRGVRAFTFPKDPSFPNSNEDTFAIGMDRAAVFDGATESFASRRWARIVARHWVRGADSWLADAREEYSESGQVNLHWAQDVARTRGSFTTLAAVVAAEDALEVTTVGDSCVLLIADGEIEVSFPYADAAAFNSAPAALGTGTSLEDDQGLLREGTGRVTRLVDTVLLVTDAVAAWLLTSDASQRSQRIARVLEVKTGEDWAGIVREERRGKTMKVDDSTVIVLELSWQT